MGKVDILENYNLPTFYHSTRSFHPSQIAHAFLYDKENYSPRFPQINQLYKQS